MGCVCCQEECLATGLNLYTNPEASLVQVHIQHIHLLGSLSLNGKSPLLLPLCWIISAWKHQDCSLQSSVPALAAISKGQSLPEARRTPGSSLQPGYLKESAKLWAMSVLSFGFCIPQAWPTLTGQPITCTLTSGCEGSEARAQLTEPRCLCKVSLPMAGAG